MSIADKSRALIVREHQQVKNRQQSMLMRAAQELGLPEEASYYW
ncbi:MAG: glutamine synthetase inactivation factor IF7A, partial [Nostoc sp.]